MKRPDPVRPRLPVGFDDRSVAQREGATLSVECDSTKGRQPEANPRLSAVAPAKVDGDASLRQGYGWQASQGALGLCIEAGGGD